LYLKELCEIGKITIPRKVNLGVTQTGSKMGFEKKVPKIRPNLLRSFIVGKTWFFKMKNFVMFSQKHHRFKITIS